MNDWNMTDVLCEYYAYSLSPTELGLTMLGLVGLGYILGFVVALARSQDVG